MRLIDADELKTDFKKQISEQDELMELCKYAGSMSNYFDLSKIQIGMITCLQALNNAPTIDPQVVTEMSSQKESMSNVGNWIDDGTKLGSCIECGIMLDKYISNLNEDNHLIQIPNFCPNCGAQMKILAKNEEYERLGEW